MSREAIKTLISEIRADLEAIERILQQIDQIRQGIKPNQPPLFHEKAAIGYLLHNLYSAFENIFKNIANVFGNMMGEHQTWHTLLLRRMTLEIESVRPRVIGSQSYDALDELRRFRHVFRHAYTLDLDWERMDLVLRKLDIGLRPRYQDELNTFLQFLEKLSASVAPQLTVVSNERP